MWRQKILKLSSFEDLATKPEEWRFELFWLLRVINWEGGSWWYLIPNRRLLLDSSNEWSQCLAAKHTLVVIKDEACKTSLLRFVYSVICTWCCCCLYIHTWGLVNKLPNRRGLFQYLTNHVWKDDLVCNKLWTFDRTNYVNYDLESTKDLGLTHPIAIFHLIG